MPADNGSRVSAPATAEALGTARLPGSGHIVDASAGIIRSGLSDFLLNLDEALLTITDRQAVPIERVRLGRLSDAVDDYGLEIYDAAGNLLFGATGALVSADNISINELSELTDDAGIIVAGKLEGQEITLDLNATGIEPVILGPNIELDADGVLALGNHFYVASNGDVTFTGDLTGASGTFSGTVSATSFTAATAEFIGEVRVKASAGVTCLILSRNGSGGSVSFVSNIFGANDFEVYNDASDALVFTDTTGGGRALFASSLAVQIDGAVGFYGTTPIVQQTGVAVTDAAIHGALVNLGLITA